ncbi:oligosaccharide flippase family protein [Desulfosporosinus sp.]|uniref:oligosaccharide flippase family protein n=1 Tax=Desulfosporosinus sp. TaxID=157907 RepID=UPI00262D8AC9|nr:oligosaccharide flippase family protein [Desulfosporosinus sp.]
MSVVKKNIIANFAGNGWTTLMAVAFVPLYIRFMGIESYGLVGIFSTLLVILGLLDMGLSATLNRELARLSAQLDKTQDMRNLLRTLELPYWGVAFVIVAIVIGLSGPIANYWVNVDKLSPTTVQQALMIMGVVIAFQWPTSLYSGGLMGLQKQVLLNGIKAFAVTLRNIGAVLVLWLISPTIQAFFIWQIFASVIHTSLTAGYLWRSLPKSGHRSHFQKELLFRVWRFAAGMTGISVTAIILTQVDKIILSKILTLEMFGYYILATVVAGALYGLIGPLFSALFPRFSQLVSLNDQVGLKELYHKSCQFMSVMILPAAIVVSFFSSEILFLWTGNPMTVANTHTIVSLLIIGTALNGLMNLPYALQLAHGWTKLAFYTNIVASILLVPMIYFLAIHYGTVGAASAWVALNAGYVLICIQIMHSRLLKGEQWRWYLYDVGVPLLVALSSALLWWLFMPDGMSKLVMFIYLTMVSATTLLASAFATPVTRQWINQKFGILKVSKAKRLNA